MNIGWNTTKNADGTYSARVYSIAYQEPTTTIKLATFRTRPQATGFAKRWTGYLRAQQRRVAA